jgi:hypothetical protein
MSEELEVEDPGYRAYGVLYIEGDDADVEPLNAATPRGDIENMSDMFAPLHRELVRLSAHPQERVSAVSDLMSEWDEAAFYKRVLSHASAEVPPRATDTSPDEA